MNKPIGYIHCKTCIQRGVRDNLEVGVLDNQTLRVDCSICQQPVGTFTLAAPLPNMKCDTCGEELGPNHTHH